MGAKCYCKYGPHYSQRAPYDIFAQYNERLRYALPFLYNVNKFLQIETNSGGFLELVLVTSITSKIFLHSSVI